MGSVALTVGSATSQRQLVFSWQTGARVGRVVDGSQPFGRDLRVHLGRCDGGVAEEFLDNPDVRPVVQHVGGAAVTQYVGGELALQPHPQPVVADDPPGSLASTAGHPSS